MWSFFSSAIVFCEDSSQEEEEEPNPSGLCRGDSTGPEISRFQKA